MLKFNFFTGKFDFVNAETSPGGADTQVQFNDGGVFGGDADLAWDKTTKVLSAKNITVATLLTLSNLTASRILATDASKGLVSSITTANLRSSVSSVTGSAGSLVFSSTPTLTTPVIAEIRGGTAVGSTLTLRSTSAAGTSDAIIFKTGNNVEQARFITGGNFGIGVTAPAQQLEISKNFRFPSTTYAAQYGVIYKDTTRFLHDFNYGNNGTVTTNGGNLFLGLGAGNFSMGGTATDAIHSSYNVGIGSGCLAMNSTGYRNTAVGNTALRFNMDGYQNVGIGCWAGAFDGLGNPMMSSHDCIYIGYYTKPSAYTTYNEIVIGTSATGAGENTIVFGNDDITNTFLKGCVSIGNTDISDENKFLIIGDTADLLQNTLHLKDSTNVTVFVVNNEGGFAFKGGTISQAETGWVATNASTTREFDTEDTTLDEVANVLGTLIDALKYKGIIL